MSSPPYEGQTSKFTEADANFGVAAVATSTSGGSSTSTSTTGSGSSAGSSSTPSARSSSSDSRRVAPKWLGKKIGRFRLQGLLGQGAVGRVFRAEDAILHRRVALKVIVVHTADGQINRNADTFLTEARAAAALEHPNVIQIFEAGETGNLCYIAMELLDGGSLKDLVVASGAMDPGRACLLAADAADALAAAHEAGIIHRDVKPANLMLTRQGRCKVTDFGLATFGDADSVSQERAAGTPLFAAPEVIRGTASDEQSDIYSLGASLFYLLTGRPPFSGKTRSEVLRKHLQEPIPDLRQLRPGLPEALVAAVEKALDKDPGQRFGTAIQFARVLRVQTIPAAPLPNMMAMGNTIGGASVLNLSGMTAVTGSSGSLRGGRSTGGEGELTVNDLLWLPPTRADAPAAEPPAPPAPLVVRCAPPPVEYATPSVGRNWQWTRSAAAAVAIASVVVLVGIVGVVFGVRASRTAVAIPLPAPTVSPALPAAIVPPPSVVARMPQRVPTAQIPTDPSVATSPVRVLPLPPATVIRLTPAEQVPLPVTDVDHLRRIADGEDADRPHRYATIVGKVAHTRPSANGRTIRIEFADTRFWIAYWATNKVISTHMTERFGTDAADLVGKTIRVTERVTIYDGQPEFILTATDHVKLVAE